MHPLECLFVIFLATMVANSQNEKCKIEIWKIDKTMIKCENLTTSNDGDYAAQFIRNNLNNAGIEMKGGNMAILPVDIFASINITYLHLDYYQMMDIPRDHINSVCATLDELWIQNSEINSGIIQAATFRNCKQLNILSIFNSGITTILPNAFQGMDNLKRLCLDDNELVSLTKESFRGLDQLVHLNLVNNNLKSLEEGTFGPISNAIQSLFLFGNPLQCHCSLQWLQDWVVDIESKKWNVSTEFTINCVGRPTDDDFIQLTLCNPSQSTSSSSSSPPPTTTPTQQPTPSAQTQSPALTECTPEEVVSKFSELLTALLKDAACYSLQKNSDEDVMSKLYSVLDVKKSIMLFESKFGKMQTSAQTQPQPLPSGDCKPDVADLSELLTALLEEASSYSMQEYSDEDILLKLNSVLGVRKLTLCDPSPTPSAQTQSPALRKRTPEEVVSKFSELLTALLRDAACYSLQKNSDEDVMSKLYSVLEVQRSIMLFESKFRKTRTSAQPQPSGDCKSVVEELSELSTALLEEASSYSRQEYSDEDMLLKLNSVLEVRKSEILLELKCGNKP